LDSKKRTYAVNHSLEPVDLYRRSTQGYRDVKMRKIAAILAAVLLMASVGAAGIPFIQQLEQSQNGFADVTSSDSQLGTGELNLEVEFETQRNSSQVATGDWDGMTPTFEEDNITGGDYGSTLLDIELQSNPGWIWFKVNQTANLENSWENNTTEPQSQEDQDLLGYWAFDEDSGPVEDVKDNDGTNHGASRGETGRFGDAYSYDGNDDYVGVPHDQRYRVQNGTLSVWFKMNDSSSNWIFSKDQNGCNGDCGHLSMAYDSFIEHNNLAVRLQNDGNGHHYSVAANQSKENIEPGEWHHAAFTFGEYGMKLYVNGELHDNHTNTEGITANELPVNIGRRYDGARHFNGKIDELRMYDRQLTSNEVNQLYNNNEISQKDSSPQFKQCQVSINSMNVDQTPVDANSFSKLDVEVQNTGDTSEVRTTIFTDGQFGETEVGEIESGNSEVYDFSLVAGDDRDQDGTIEVKIVSGPNCEQTSTQQQNYSVDYSGDPAVARANISPRNAEVGEPVTFDLGTEKSIQGQKWTFSERAESDNDWNFEEETTSNQETVTRTYDAPGYYPYILRIYREDGSNQPYSGHVKVSPQEEPREQEEPVCPDETPNEGELGEYIRFQVWYDDNDGEYEPEDEEIIFNGTGHQFGNFGDFTGPGLGEGGLLDGNFQGPSDFDQQPFQPGTHHLGIRWNVPEDAPCQIQTDEKRYDFDMVAQQSRHAPNPGDDWEGGFGDKEESNENYFRAGEIRKPQEQEENETKNVCGPVLNPEGEVEIQRTSEEENRTVSYNAEIKDNKSVKFIHTGSDGLGDSSVEESEVFTVTVGGNVNDTVYIKTKSGQLVGTAALSGEGDIQMDTSGQYNVEIVEINDLGEKTEFKIKISSNGREGQQVKELSHIEFSFCEPIEKKTYWQLDLTEDSIHVPQSDSMSKNLVLAALSDEFDGEKIVEGPINPSLTRSQEFLQPEPDEFEIEDGKATAKFKVDSDEEEKVVLAAYEMPGPYKDSSHPDMDFQKLHDVANGSFKKGEVHSLTVDLPGGKYPAPENMSEGSDANVVFSEKGPFELDGTERKEFSHEEDYELSNGTLSMTFKMDDDSENFLFSKDEDGCTGKCGHLSVSHKTSFINGDGLGVRLQSESGEDAILEPEEKIDVGERYNLTVTWGKEGTELFLNGEFQDRDALPGGIENNKNKVVLGEMYNGESGTGLDGTVGNVKIFDKRLSRKEIN